MEFRLMAWLYFQESTEDTQQQCAYWDYHKPPTYVHTSPVHAILSVTITTTTAAAAAAGIIFYLSSCALTLLSGYTA